MPEIACRIVWNHQILKQLDFCMKRVADVLGEDWANYKDGIKLSNLKSYLFRLFKAWI